MPLGGGDCPLVAAVLGMVVIIVIVCNHFYYAHNKK